MKFHRQIFFLIPVLLLNVLQPTKSYGQQSADPVEKLKSYLAKTANEKLYVHLSRPDPVTGELLWFSVFALDQQTHRPLTLSSFAYAEPVSYTHLRAHET
jgi:hypothetical protein